MAKRDLKDLSAGELKNEYRKVMVRSRAPDHAHFTTAVHASLAEKGIESPTPLQFVKAALAVSFRCARCAGTGQFITGSVNGKPSGPGGTCFRCEGKGRQSDRDARRNDYYDEHRTVSI